MRAPLFFILLTCLTVSCKSKSHTTTPFVTSRSESILTDLVQTLPQPLGVVSDYENVFSENQKLDLQNIIEAFETRTGNQIAIVTIKSYRGYSSLADYAAELANQWGIGQAEKNNGLLIVLSTSHREVRISTGLGTEKILTDAVCQEIIAQNMVPYFKKGNYLTGVKEGMYLLIQEWCPQD